MIEPEARIIAFVVARIGDTLLVTPALRALKAACPLGSLTVAAHPKRMEVLDQLPFIDRLEAASKPRLAVGRLLGRQRFDWGFVWGHDLALVRHALAIADRVVSFRRGDAAIDARLYRAVDPPTAPEHAVMERLRLPRAVGADTAQLHLDYRVSATEAARAGERLKALFPARPTPLVAMQVKSFPTKAYRDWPYASFEALTARLTATHSRAGVVVLGDRASAECGRTLAARFPASVRNLAGTTSLRETAAMLSLMDLYVGIDTGPTHLAGALGLPMVAMYHCRHRGRLLAPLQHRALEVIEHPAQDSECSDTAPMDCINVDVVWEAVERRLAALGANRA